MSLLVAVVCAIGKPLASLRRREAAIWCANVGIRIKLETKRSCDEAELDLPSIVPSADFCDPSRHFLGANNLGI